MPEPTPTQRVTTALFYGFLALVAWLSFKVFEPFLTPLIWAAVVVILLLPWHRRLERRMGKRIAASLSTVIATVILVVPMLLVVIAFLQQAVSALSMVQVGTFLSQISWLNHAWEWLAAHLPGRTAADLPDLLREGLRRLTTVLAGQLGLVVRNIVIFLFDVVITIIAMFYFFRDADTIMMWVRRSLPVAEEQRESMIAQTHDLVFVTVASTLAGAGVTGLVSGLTFWAVGLHAVVFWGVVMAFFALLPVLGAWMVWIPAAGWLVAQGHVGRAIVLLLVCGVAVLLIDNVMRPMMISGRVELSGLLVLVGVLGGIVVFGMIGVVLGPVVIAIASGLLHAYTKPLSGRGQDETSHSAVLE
ncbi:MAG: AI-2E family transporter [Acidobacteriota bacterium]|nr:AI-2E family transporter [Acidobacteriota bacterium]